MHDPDEARAAGSGEVASEDLQALLRWERSGAVWRVLGRRADEVTVGLFTCDGGEEMDRLSSSDPVLLRHVAGRDSNDTLP
ncbi:MAG: hypothetical protein WBQ50_05715 [Nocardioides sp.]